MKPHALHALAAALLLAGPTLADAVDDAFRQIYGTQVASVKATAEKDDDVRLAKELLTAARRSTEQLKLMTLLAENAHELGAVDSEGYATAIAAMELIAKHHPDRTDEAAEKIYPMRQRLVFTARGEDKEQLSRGLIRDLYTLARVRERAGEWDQAMEFYRRALSTADRIDSDLKEVVRAAIDTAASRKRQYEQLEALREKIKKDPKDEQAVKDFIHLCVVDLDQPDEARKYTFLVSDPTLKQNVRLASRDPETLGDPDSLHLGDWYRELAGAADTDAKKARLLRRARACFTRFIEVHADADLALTKAKISLANVEKSLAKFGPVTGTIAPPTPGVPITPPTPDKPQSDAPWKQAIVFKGLDARLSPSPADAIAFQFKQRTIEAWVLADGDGGVLWDEGGYTHGMALSVQGNDVRFNVRILGHGHEIIGPIPDKSKWFHVAGQFSNGIVMLFIDGRPAGAKKTQGLKNLPKYTDAGTGLGGSNGYNAGRWSATGFGGKVAQFRLTNGARYRGRFTPREDLTADRLTLLLIDAEELPIGPLSAPFKDHRTGKVRWDPSGSIEIVKP